MRSSEKLSEAISNTILDRSLAIGEFNDRAIEDGVGWRDTEGCDAAYEYIFPALCILSQCHVADLYLWYFLRTK